MERKIEEEIFDNLWKEYLELDKLIHENVVKAEYDQGATYKKMIYDLCIVAKQMNLTLVDRAKTLWSGNTVQTIESFCRVNRNDLDEIAERMTKVNRK